MYSLGIITKPVRLYIVCVKINNEECFFTAFPFEKFILFYFWFGLDVVRSTGNLFSIVYSPSPCSRPSAFEPVISDSSPR